MSPVGADDVITTFHAARANGAAVGAAGASYDVGAGTSRTAAAENRAHPYRKRRVDFCQIDY